MASQTIPNASGVYRITCIITGKFYIGSSVNLRDRWYEHSSQLRRNTHHSITLQRAFNKHGKDAFVFEVLELVLFPFLLEREQHWIDKLKPFDPGKGYNIALDAQASFTGRKHSPESLAKMRVASIGQYHPPEEHATQIQTLIITSPDGEIHTVRGVKQFCREHNLDISCLMRVAKGEEGRKQHKGWTARFP
jgi:group I intron endonuclease